MTAIQGERIPGGFILITGMDGVRYAVRHHAVAVIHDADECHDETIVQLHGGHFVRVPRSLDEVLGWFAQETGLVPLYAARIEDLGPGDFVKVIARNEFGAGDAG